ncbi:claudin-4-like [Amblyraja radiata]|uniref:claudin-4-like n=1 Tax=Amblyraja radiata TaxID=386614 RepID=UPI0014031D8A|nr:claudin-4-like [Amblyraja radiata]
MVSMGLQILGIALCVFGWLGALLTCVLPMWRVTAFIGNNIVVAQIIWEGLWMNCIVQSTGQMQCKVYDSLLALSQDLQASRALTVISLVVGIMGILVSIAGGKCTNCIENEATKAKVTIISGIIFILAGVTTLIPVSWSANTIIKDFYNPLVTDAQRRELGASLYIGWGTSGLLLLGGALLCCSCPPKDDNAYSAKYSAPRSAASKNYV